MMCSLAHLLSCVIGTETTPPRRSNGASPRYWVLLQVNHTPAASWLTFGPEISRCSGASRVFALLCGGGEMWDYQT
jgi:hypothetical protein